MTAASHDAVNSVFAAQSSFRAVLNAVARPGTLQPLVGVADAPKPLSGDAAAIALALFDHDTPVWLDDALSSAPDVPAWLRFHTGAPIAKASGLAAFALIGDPERLPPLSAFANGSAEYPDRSTTLVLQVSGFSQGEVLSLSGPGIRDVQPFQAAPLPADMAERVAGNRSLFPRGVDLLFAGSGLVAAIPRSARLQRS